MIGGRVGRLFFQNRWRAYTSRMSPKVAALLEDALALDASERADLAGALIESLDPGVDSDAEASWNQVIARRVQELEAGTTELVPWSEVRERLFRGFERAPLAS